MGGAAGDAGSNITALAILAGVVGFFLKAWKDRAEDDKANRERQRLELDAARAREVSELEECRKRVAALEAIVDSKDEEILMQRKLKHDAVGRWAASATTLDMVADGLEAGSDLSHLLPLIRQILKRKDPP